MAAYRVQLTRSAEKELRRLPRDVVARLTAAIDRMQEDPTRARPGLDVKRLRGTKSTWRVRVGDHRGIYEIEGRVVVFTRFGHRSRIYDAG